VCETPENTRINLGRMGGHGGKKRELNARAGVGKRGDQEIRKSGARGGGRGRKPGGKKLGKETRRSGVVRRSSVCEPRRENIWVSSQGPGGNAECRKERPTTSRSIKRWLTGGGTVATLG